MTYPQAITILREYNDWRHDDTDTMPTPDLKLTGEALDVVTSTDPQLRVVEYIERIGCPACVNANLLIELAKIKELIKNGGI